MGNEVGKGGIVEDNFERVEEEVRSSNSEAAIVPSDAPDRTRPGEEG
jgi:hypothetical protein